jgi:hypothetical protein
MFSRKSRPNAQAQPETGHQLCGTSPHALHDFSHLEKRVGEVWHGSIAPESWWLLRCLLSPLRSWVSRCF